MRIVNNLFITSNSFRTLLFCKYSAGHVVGLAGSHGMAGAALLASTASLKSGAGIVHLLHPEEYASEFYQPVFEWLNKYFVEITHDIIIDFKLDYLNSIGNQPYNGRNLLRLPTPHLIRAYRK